MLCSRLLFCALIAASASVTSAAPAVLDAGDALDARMAKLEATVGNLKEQDVNEEWSTQSSSKPMTHDWGWGSKSKFGKKKTLGPKVPKKTTCERVAECKAETLKEQDVKEEWGTSGFGWGKKKTLAVPFCDQVAKC